LRITTILSSLHCLAASNRIALPTWRISTASCNASSHLAASFLNALRPWSQPPSGHGQVGAPTAAVDAPEPQGLTCHVAATSVDQGFQVRVCLMLAGHAPHP